MSKNNKSRKAIKQYNFRSFFTSAYGIFLFTIFLFYTWHGFSDILEAKTACFAIGTLVYIVLGGIYLLYISISKREWPCIKDKFYCFLGFFFLSSLLSSLLCGDINRAMKAVEGKRFGFIILFLCIASCLIVYETFSWNTILMIGLFVGSGIFALLTIANRFGVDPLGFYVGIAPHQIKGFLATFGQMNLVSEFLCLSLAIWAALYFIREDKYENLYLSGAFLATLAGLATASEGFFLGIFGTLFLLLMFAFDDMASFFQYAKLCTTMYVSLLCLAILNITGSSTYSWDSIHAFLLSIQGIVVSFLLLGMIWGVYYLLKRKNLQLEARKRIRKGILIISFLAGILLLVAMILCTSGILSFPENVDKYLFFGDSWGTNRGFVWIRTLREFFKMPVKKILFGCGLGGFDQFFTPYFEESILSLGYYFVDAHNVFLQFLVTMGVLGSCSFYGGIIYMFIRAIRNYEKDKKFILVATVLLVWTLQSMINNPLVMNMPYIFYLLAWGKIRNGK